MLAVIMTAGMTLTTAWGVSYFDFKDVKGHWAESYLEQAVRDGILNGTSSTTLEPNGTLTGSQMAAILVRSNGLQHFTDFYPGTQPNEWYYYEAAVAYSAGILPADASVDMKSPVTRGQVFIAMRNTFFAEEKTEESEEDILAGFKDAEQLTEEERDAAEVLVCRSVLLGDDRGCLNPGNKISRAEFVALLYRAAAYKTQIDEPGSSNIRNLRISLTADKVAPGERLKASAVITGVENDFVCEAAWIYDRSPLAGYSNSCKYISEGEISACGVTLQFSKRMPLSHRIGLLIMYTDPVSGEKTYVYAEKSVTVQNYSDEYYQEILYKEALKTVSCKYTGGTPDYSTDIKEAFVNGKGYTSKTKYLIWVNLASQKVNIFEKSDGRWSLIHTYRCATGASSTPTPVVETYVTYKEEAWKTSTYIVRPITRFYPNTGYAFHSILFAPDGSGRVVDGTMGKPASHGCVRTEEDGVWWIYYNIPVKTAVIIY